MSESYESKRLTEAEERYARIEERIKPFISKRKEAEWVRREVWRSGSASPFKPTERPKIDFYATSHH